MPSHNNEKASFNQLFKIYLFLGVYLAFFFFATFLIFLLKFAQVAM